MIKDIVAIANSGGRIILFRLLNDGAPSGADLSGVAALDPAKITDAIYKYTDCQFQEFELKRVPKGSHQVWAIIIPPVSVPVVFSQTGNYADSSGKHKNAFLVGTLLFPLRCQERSWEF